MNRKKKKAVLAYLDGEEKEMLEQIAEGWGASLSRAIARLIREKNDACN